MRSKLLRKLAVGLWIAIGLTAIPSGTQDGEALAQDATPSGGLGAATPTPQSVSRAFEAGLEIPVDCAAGPNWVATARMNADEFPDLIVSVSTTLGTGVTGGAVQVCLGRGDGSFTPAQTYALGEAGKVGPNAGILAVADFDGDGDSDVICASGSEAKLYVFVGDGTGALTRGPDILLPSSVAPTAFAAGDFDTRDGLDASEIVVGDASTRTLRVIGGSLLAGGSTVLCTTTGTASSLAGATFATSADLDDDASRDLVVFNRSTHTLTLLQGNGQGILSIVGPDITTGYRSPGYARTCVAADFNGDGRDDIATPADGTSRGVGLMLSAKGGAPYTYDEGGTTPLLPGSGYLAVAARIDDDANIDLSVSLVGWSQPGTAWFSGLVTLKGRGDGTFDEPKDVTVGADPYGLAVADLDGDRRMDLVTANSVEHSLSIRLNDGQGGFLTRTDVGAGAKPRGVAMADLNDDKIDDLVIALSGEDKVGVLLGKSGGGFEPVAQYAVGPQPYSVAVGDLNGDQVPDLALADCMYTTRRGVVSVLLGRKDAVTGKGDGTFLPEQRFENGLGNNPRWIAITNLDADLIQNDIVVGNYYPGDISILRNTGTAGAVDFAPDAGSPHRSGSTLNGYNPMIYDGAVVPDLDGDGIPEILTACLNSSSIGVHTSKAGNGRAAFDLTGSVGLFDLNDAPGALPNPFQILAANVTGDALTDLIVLRYPGKISVLRGLPSAPYFEVEPQTIPGAFDRLIACADFTGDKKPDIVASGSHQRYAPSTHWVTVLPGDGTGKFGANPADLISYETAHGPHVGVVGEFTGDSLRDLAVTCPADGRYYGGSTVSVLQGATPLWGTGESIGMGRVYISTEVETVPPAQITIEPGRRAQIPIRIDTQDGVRVPVEVTATLTTIGVSNSEFCAIVPTRVVLAPCTVNVEVFASRLIREYLRSNGKPGAVGVRLEFSLSHVAAPGRASMDLTVGFADASRLEYDWRYVPQSYWWRPAGVGAPMIGPARASRDGSTLTLSCPKAQVAVVRIRRNSDGVVVFGPETEEHRPLLDYLVWQDGRPLSLDLLALGAKPGDAYTVTADATSQDPIALVLNTFDMQKRGNGYDVFATGLNPSKDMWIIEASVAAVRVVRGTEYDGEPFQRAFKDTLVAAMLSLDTTTDAAAQAFGAAKPQTAQRIAGDMLKDVRALRAITGDIVSYSEAVANTRAATSQGEREQWANAAGWSLLALERDSVGSPSFRNGMGNWLQHATVDGKEVFGGDVEKELDAIAKSLWVVKKLPAAYSVPRKWIDTLNQGTLTEIQVTVRTPAARPGAIDFGTGPRYAGAPLGGPVALGGTYPVVVSVGDKVHRAALDSELRCRLELLSPTGGSFIPVAGSVPGSGSALLRPVRNGNRVEFVGSVRIPEYSPTGDPLPTGAWSSRVIIDDSLDTSAESPLFVTRNLTDTPPPTNVSARVLEQGGVDVSWTPAIADDDGPVCAKVWRRSVGTSVWTYLGAAAPCSGQFIDRDVTLGAAVQYSVSHLWDSGQEGRRSDPITVRTDGGAVLRLSVRDSATGLEAISFGAGAAPRVLLESRDASGLKTVDHVMLRHLPPDGTWTDLSTTAGAGEEVVVVPAASGDSMGVYGTHAVSAVVTLAGGLTLRSFVEYEVLRDSVPAPPVPFGVIASGNALRVKWDTSEVHDGVTLDVYRAEDPSAPLGQPAWRVVWGSGDILDSAVTTGTRYYYRVVSRRGGAMGLPSPWANAVAGGGGGAVVATIAERWVLDAAGRVVRRLPPGLASWDWTDDGGAPVADGYYTIVDRAEGGGEQRTSATVDRVAPWIAIDQPAHRDGASVSVGGSSLEVSGRAGDGIGLQEVIWEVERGARGVARGTGRWSARVDLTLGVNRLRVTALDGSGNATTEIVDIDYTPRVLRLRPGYNLVGLPCVPVVALRASTLLRSINDSGGDATVVIDAASAAGSARHASGAGPDFELIDGRAYFVQSGTTSDVAIVAGVHEAVTEWRALSHGQNYLVIPVRPGSPRRASDVAADIAAQGGRVRAILRWKDGAFVPYLPGKLLNDFDIVVGEGFVVDVENDCVWEVKP